MEVLVSYHFWSGKGLQQKYIQNRNYLKIISLRKKKTGQK